MIRTRVHAKKGTWRRWVCAAIGHENIGTIDLVTGSHMITCLRCWGSAWGEPDPIVTKSMLGLPVKRSPATSWVETEEITKKVR